MAIIKHIEIVDWRGKSDSHALKPITLIGGPNGSGKSSLLAALRVALYGKTPSLARAGDLYTAFGDGKVPAVVRVTLADGAVIQRKIRPDGMSQRLGGPDGPRITHRDLAEMMDAYVPPHDALLSPEIMRDAMGTPKAATQYLAGLADPDAAKESIEGAWPEMNAALGAVYGDDVPDAPVTLDELAELIERVHGIATHAADQAESAQRDAAKASEAQGSRAELKAQADEIGLQIGGLRATYNALNSDATLTHAERMRIDEADAELATLRTAQDAEPDPVDVDAAERAYLDKKAEKEACRAKALKDIDAQIAEKIEARDGAAAKAMDARLVAEKLFTIHAELKASADARQSIASALKGMDGKECACPNCGTAIDLGNAARAVLDEVDTAEESDRIASAWAEHQDAVASARSAEVDAAALDMDVANLRKRRDTIADKPIDEHGEVKPFLDAWNAAKAQAKASEQAKVEAQRRADKIAELEAVTARRADVESAMADLDVRITDLSRKIEEAQSAHDDVTRKAAAFLASGDAAKAFADATAKHEAAKSLKTKLEDVLAAAVESSLATIIDSANAYLVDPAGRSFAVQSRTRHGKLQNDIGLRRGDDFTAYANLSTGEQLLFLWAFAVALAAKQPQGKRLAILDNLDDLMADYQAALIERVAEAVRAGAIDHVVMAAHTANVGTLDFDDEDVAVISLTASVSPEFAARMISDCDDDDDGWAGNA